jgi:hypothetical protein
MMAIIFSKAAHNYKQLDQLEVVATLSLLGILKFRQEFSLQILLSLMVSS